MNMGCFSNLQTCGGGMKKINYLMKNQLSFSAKTSGSDEEI